MSTEFIPANLLHGFFIGDEETYIFLFKEYYVGLCAYSRRYVGRKDIAEEIVSETFLKIWENRSSIIIHSSIKSYLFQAVCNNSLNYVRKLKSENKLELYFQDTQFNNIGFVETVEEIEEKSLLMTDFSLEIEKAMSQLPPQQQKAFRLKRQDGKKIREIAQMMGLSVKTVEMHLSKATINLRERLKNLIPSFLIFLWLN
ncbi:MAG: RNA polymerase sigma-70 factor [Prolixibacteraceae bacterium]